MGRRFSGAMLLGFLLAGQATAIAGLWLKHEHQVCACHQHICVCPYRNRQPAKPAKPAKPSCHSPSSKTGESNLPDMKLQGCEDGEEKDAASVPVYLLPPPVRLAQPMPGAIEFRPAALRNLGPILEISPPPPRMPLA